MIAIDMRAPKNCCECPFLKTDDFYHCIIMDKKAHSTGISIPDILVKPFNCPVMEVATEADCAFGR